MKFVVGDNMTTEPIVEVKVTGYLPIDSKDAHILDYMTNIDCKSYKDLLGVKYEEKDIILDSF